MHVVCAAGRRPAPPAPARSPAPPPAPHPRPLAPALPPPSTAPTPSLHIAALRGNLEVARALLDADADAAAAEPGRRTRCAGAGRAGGSHHLNLLRRRPPVSLALATPLTRSPSRAGEPWSTRATAAACPPSHTPPGRATSASRAFCWRAAPTCTPQTTGHRTRWAPESSKGAGGGGGRRRLGGLGFVLRAGSPQACAPRSTPQRPALATLTPTSRNPRRPPHLLGSTSPCCRAARLCTSRRCAPTPRLRARCSSTT
jgi:hypothetical protein